MYQYWFIWLSLVMVAGVDDDQYCSLRYHRLCQGKGTHVGCMFPQPGFGPACENSTSVDFTDNIKNFILHFINRKRSRIASGHEKVRGGERLPKPESMMFVGWDSELAYLAQRLADQCLFTHDECRATVRYPYAGQTVGEVRWHSDLNPSVGVVSGIGRVFEAWWGEKRRATAKQIISPFKLGSKGAVWGHFSQLANSQLRALGCGAVIHGAVRHRLLLVCDFSHTNMLGQPTITAGNPVACPLHTARAQAAKYPLLCAPIKLEQQLKTPKEQQVEFYNEDDYNENRENLYFYDEQKDVAFRTEPKADKTAKSLSQTMRTRGKGSSNIYEIGRRSRISTQGSIELLNRKKLISEANIRIYANNVTDVPLGKWRDTYEYVDLKERHTTNKYMDKIMSVRFRATTSTADSMYSEEIKQTARHRWKQSRNRPRRPGASALLNTPQVQIQVASRRPFVAPITLDKEDMEQLYQDTGFKVNMRKYNRDSCQSCCPCCCFRTCGECVRCVFCVTCCVFLLNMCGAGIIEEDCCGCCYEDI